MLTRSGPRPRVAIALPAWRADAFVAETLASVLRQTYREFSLHVCVDGSDEQTAERCAAAARDSRVTVVLQPSRLGWVGNTNAALRAGAGAEFSLIMPHDDLVAPNYLETLVSRATAFADAACIYSDMKTFGLAPNAGHGRFVQANVTGSPFQRQQRLLAAHFSAVAFRGLVRQVRGEPLLLRGNDGDDYAADTLYMAQIARHGNLLRVKRPLYRKRYHAGNTHSAWEKWDARRQCRAWRVHCRGMLAEALTCAGGAIETAALISAAEARLVSSLRFVLPLVGALSALDLNDQLAVFRSEVSAALNIVNP